MKLRIGVIGSSSKLPSNLESIARNVGKEVAKIGAVLISGGRGGVMAASCQGAKENNGIVIGILPEPDLEKANPHIDVAITTGIGYARNFINIASSDVVISICGAGGTLSEIGFAIALQKRLILMKGTGGVTDIIAESIGKFEDADIRVANTPKEAINQILALKK